MAKAISLHLLVVCGLQIALVIFTVLKHVLGKRVCGCRDCWTA